MRREQRLGGARLSCTAHRLAHERWRRQPVSRPVEQRRAATGTDTAIPTEQTDKLYSLVGKQLKLDDAAAVQPYLDQLAALPDVEEVRFGGNTLGIQACEAIAKELESKRSLRVSSRSPPRRRRVERSLTSTRLDRLPTFPTSLPAG